MRRVHDDHVNTGGNQRCDAIVRVIARTDRGADAQCATAIFACARIVFRFLEILRRDHALELEIVANDEYFLDAVLVQQ